MTRYQGLKIYQVELSQFSLELQFVARDVTDAARKALMNKSVIDTYKEDAHRKPTTNDITSVKYLFTTD